MLKNEIDFVFLFFLTIRNMLGTSVSQGDFTNCHSIKIIAMNCHLIFTYEIFLDDKVCQVDNKTAKNTLL